MILPKHEGRFLSLTQPELDRILAAMSIAHPELHELEDMDPASLVAYCRDSHISQAEVIMSLARDPHPDAVSAVERLLGHEIDRRSPREVEIERHKAEVASRPSPPPPKPASSTTDTRRIELLVDKCPKREGTSAHKLWQIYKSGMTVQEFLARGGTMAAIRWDLDHKFIALSDD